MKISKFLVLGMLVSLLCMAGLASAQPCILADGIGPSGGSYGIGDTICYEISLTSLNCNMTNVNVYFFAPDNQPAGLPCASPTDGVLIASGLSLTDGVTVTIDCVDNTDLAYTVKAADLVDADGLTLTAKIATEFTPVGGVEDCDQATVTNEGVLPEPDIEITKTGSILGFCEGPDPTSVTYTYEVTTGDSDVDMVILSVIDDTCGPVTPVDEDVDGYNDGDTDTDNELDTDETWLYECTTSISEETYNVVEVTAQDIYALIDPVTDTSDWLVEVVEPPGVEVTLDPAEICEGETSEACVDIDPEEGNYEIRWTLDDVPIPDTDDLECIDATEAGEYCAKVKDLDTLCEAEACETLIVNPNPTCSIEAVADPICPSEDGNILTAIASGPVPILSWTWAVTEGTGWEIESGQGTDTIEYSVGPDATGCATFTLTIIDENGCEGECEIEVCCTGDTFCTFTQGFYGNAGGKACDGRTTTEIINLALANAGGPITIGRPGNSMTFDSAECIIKALPAGGKPRALPADNWTCAYLNGGGKGKGNKNRIRNVLVGQVLALTLNTLISEDCIEDSGDLLALTLPDEFCVVPYDDPEACPMKYTIPELLVGKTVAELLELANDALAGEELPDGITIGMIYEAATALNEGFDECATIVACPTEEICCNGCDDDFDGLTDGDDPDCAEICDDDIDNDCDGLTDLDDPDCVD